MPTPLAFLTVYSLAFALALAFYPVLSAKRSVRVYCILVLGSAIALTPLLVPGDAPFARLVAACITSFFVLKIVDLHVGACQSWQPSFAEFLAFLGNPMQFVQRRTGCERQPSRGRNTRDYLLSLGGILLAFGVFRWAGSIDWSDRAFLWQHAARAGSFFVYILFLFQNLAAVLRAMGVYSIDPVRQPLTARTPAEFWRRYNRWMGQFLNEDVFKPLRGHQHPRLATLAVFAVSGLFHEYLFLVATGRVQGYQMLFFMIQGVAVALTLRKKPVGVAAVAWLSVTLVFNLLSSVFFFVSWQGVGRFYSTGLPEWLPD